jgi:hypothetical protein
VTVKAVSSAGSQAELQFGRSNAVASIATARPIVTYLGVPPVRLDTLGRGGYCGVSAGCNYRRIPRDRADRRAVAAPPGKKCSAFRQPPRWRNGSNVSLYLLGWMFFSTERTTSGRRQLDISYGQSDRTIAWASPASRREPEQLRRVRPWIARLGQDGEEQGGTDAGHLRGRGMAKAAFVVACRPDGVRWTATNDPEGIAATVARLRTMAPTLIVVEATGGYERALVGALAAAALPVVVANPRQVRDFARATGQLAKTDRLDADLLALFAERVRPTPRPSRNRSCSS